MAVTMDNYKGGEESSASMRQAFAVLCLPCKKMGQNWSHDDCRIELI